MTYSFPKPAAYAFIFTAALYLFCVNFICYPLTTFLKPVPILCLMIGVFQSNLVRWAKVFLLLALVYSLAGDIVLTLPIILQIEIGIGCFFLAHCCYIVLFLKSFEFNSTRFLWSLPIFLVMIVVVYFLTPYLGDLLIPVMLYFAVWTLMVFSAFQVKRECTVVASGVILFLLSDIVLALNLFMYPDINVTIFVMFAYYAAQFFLTWGLVRLYKR